MFNRFYIDYYTNKNKTALKVKHFNNINDLLLFCLNEKYINVLIDFEKASKPIITHEKENIINYLKMI